MSEIQVPKDWKLVKLEELGKIITGKTPSTNNPEFYGDDYPFYKPADLNQGNEIFTSKNGLSEKGLKEGRFLPKNTILVTCIGTIGKSSIITKSGSCNQQLNAIIVNEKIALPKFVFYWINTLYFQNLMKQNASNTTLRIINKSKFQTLPIIVPSLEIQKKIIEKLDSILEHLTENKKTIFNINQKNQSLTNALYDEINGVIITKYFESDIVKTNSDYKIIKDVCILNPSKSELIDIPDDFEVSFVPMRSVDDIEGIIKTPEIRFLKDVKKGYTYFKENDVIFAKITPCMENGKAAIGQNLKNNLGFGSTEFHVLRTKGKILPEWIYFFVRQNKFRKDAKKVMKGSAGQQRVPLSFIQNYKIPVPELKIQKQIIAQIKNSKPTVLRIQENIKPLLTKLKKSESKLENLHLSILDRAFSGLLLN